MAADYEELFVGDGDYDGADDEDDISLTSTVESVHDADKEFVVDAILAERPSRTSNENGDMEYLIQWQDYPMDQCTWEAVENLSEDLQEQWQQQREEELSGQRQPFSLQIYEEAIAEAVRSRAARHNRRNEKRQRLNLPLTEPLPAELVDASPLTSTSKEDSESDVEAMEVDEIEPAMPMTVSAPKAIKQTTFKGIPLAKPALPQTKSGSSNPPDLRPDTSKPPSKLTAVLNDQTSPVTVWQGTARKPKASEKITAKPMAVALKTQSTASSASLRNKFGKSFKATRTQVPKAQLPRSTTVSVPALVLKAARKRRVNLKDAMMDPTKTPKLMTNLRSVNQLRKKGAELNDAAPSDPSQIPAAFFITETQPKRSQSSDQVKDHRRRDINRPVADTAQVPPAGAMSNGPKKDRKSVRFDISPLVEEPMDIDSRIMPTDSVKIRSQTRIASKKLSLATYQERSGTQSLMKTASFGPEGSRDISVIFSGIARVNDQWLKMFLSEQILSFRTVCTSEDFFSGDCLYKPGERLSSGLLESTTDQEALDAVANNLCRASSGFYLANVGYSVLIYPGHCTGWANLVDLTVPSDVALRHLIFRTTPSLTLNHYPPLSIVMDDRAHVTSDSALIRLRLMREISTFDHRVLQPSVRSGDNSNKKQAYFLLFHPSEDFLFRIFSLWLRACQPKCLIFYNAQEGSWKRFLEETNAGAVILHDSVEKSIRRVPKLWDVLKYGRHNFWSLSSSDHETKLFPVVSEETSNGRDIQRLPPQLKMIRLFPHGRAFLITPSFAISEPARLCHFLQFFLARSKFAPCVLVACADFPQYLLDLAMEKAVESDEFKKRNLRDLYPDKKASSEGFFNSKDTHDRVRSWQLMKDIVERCQQGFGPDEPGEDIRRTVWVDDIISPDDEQSILNWFAAWSMTRLDTYRKFYVIGSSASGIRKARRRVRVPNYTLETVNNPAAAFARVTASQRSANDQSPMSESRSADGAAMAPDGQAPPLSSPYIFRSEIFRSDRASELRAWIMRLIFNGSKSWSRLYDNPVSWTDLKMSDHFKDPRSEYATYTNWFNFPPKFHSRVNTYIALFYTIETEWDENDQELPARRHPWIAVFRPVNPHFSQDSYTKMELLIWDCAAPRRWPMQPDKDKYLRKGELLPMQRRLIEFVQEQAPKRFEEYYLERVFVGGWHIPAILSKSSPIDVTCGVIKEFMNNARELLPPWDVLLFEQGWRKVSFGPHDSAAPSTDWTGADPSFPAVPSAPKKGIIPKCALDLEEPERIIFHPPRTKFAPQSTCSNDLYDAALQARKEDPECMTFEYRYRPTLDWYQELRRGNCAHQHMNVDTWEMIFDDLRITR